MEYVRATGEALRDAPPVTVRPFRGGNQSHLKAAESVARLLICSLCSLHSDWTPAPMLLTIRSEARSPDRYQQTNNSTLPRSLFRLVKNLSN